MNVILIDDEQLAIDFLQRQLMDIQGIHILGSYVNPITGLDAVIEKEVDVIFLDIHMPSVDGVELARRILQKKPHVQIVFVTAFEQYAVDAFEINATDYLVKPIQYNRLKATIARVQRKLANSSAEDKHVESRPLRVFMCKQFRIEQGDQPRTSLSWRTARAKELFLFLLQNRNEVVHKEQIAELLWPDVDLEKAFAQLYTTVYHVRNVLKGFSRHFQLENATSGYILYAQHIELDVQMWEESIQSLPAINEQTIIAYEQAMKLYSASYLHDHHYIWAIPEAERLDQMWIRIALNMGEFLESVGRERDAYEWHEYICTRYPAVEEAHFAVMKQFAKEGKSLYVHQQYATLEHELEEEFGLEPSGYVTQWYDDWVKVDRVNF